MYKEIGGHNLNGELKSGDNLRKSKNPTTNSSKVWENNEWERDYDLLLFYDVISAWLLGGRKCLWRNIKKKMENIYGKKDKKEGTKDGNKINTELCEENEGTLMRIKKTL